MTILYYDSPSGTWSSSSQRLHDRRHCAAIFSSSQRPRDAQKAQSVSEPSLLQASGKKDILLFTIDHGYFVLKPSCENHKPESG